MSSRLRQGSLLAAAAAMLVATATLTGQGVPPPPPPPPPGLETRTPLVGTGAVSGVVVDGATGQPVPGAIVAIASGARGAAPDPGKIATDARGRFVFTRLPAAGYSLTASKHGYSNARYGEGDPGALSASRTIQLADGQRFADGRIVIWRTGSISGTLTDEAGEPVVGAAVRVIARVTVAGHPQLASGATARTDDLGHFRVSGLEPGLYVVLVPSVQASVPSSVTLEELAGFNAETVRSSEAAGRTLAIPDPTALVAGASHRVVLGNYATPPPPSAEGWSYPPTFFPNAQTIADASTIDLRRAEQRTGILVRLTPVRTVRVSGIVQGPAGSTPAQMTVRVLPSGNDALGFGSESATALVAADGSFTLLNVPSGTHTIVVSRASMEYQMAGSAGISTAPPGCNGGGGGFFALGQSSSSVRASYRSCAGDAAFSARMPLAVADRDMSGVVIPLVRAVSLSGRIVLGDAQPDPNSAAARIGGVFFAEPANGDPLLGLPSGRTTPEDLTRFRITGLLPGAYVLRPQILSGVVKSIEWQGRDYTNRPFDTTSGRDIEDVVVTMTTAITRVRGSVRDAKNGIAATGSVIGFPTDRSLWVNYGMRPALLQSIGISTTGAYGLSLPAGEYFVVAFDQIVGNDWMDPKFLEAASAVATRVSVTWGETKALDLKIAPITVRR